MSSKKMLPNNKEIFSVSLFVNNFLRLKLFGIIFSLLFAGSTWLGLYTQCDNMTRYQTADGYSRYFSKTVLISGYYEIFLGLVLVMVPVLTIMAFQYNNKKNSSDFYNSLPYTRINMYLTKIAAIFSWVVIGVLAVDAAFLSIKAIYGSMVVLDASDLIWVNVTVVVSALFIETLIALACALTGNIVGNVWLSAIILCAPVTLYIIASAIVESECRFIVDLGIVSYLFEKLSFTGAFMMAMDHSDWYMLSRWTVAFTLVKSLVVLAAGIYIYKLRKAETAENVAYYPWLITTMRTMVGCIIFELAIMMIVMAEEPAIGLGLVALGVMAMVVYDFMAGDRFNRVKKVITSTGIAAVIAIAFFVVCFLGGKAADSYSPKSENIDYVQIEYNGYNYGSFSDYHTRQLAELKITDRAIIEQVVAMYNKGLSMVNGQNVVKEIEEPVISSKNYNALDIAYPYSIKVTFGEGMSVRRRQMTAYYDANDFMALVRTMSNCEEVSSVAMSIPEYNESSIRGIAAMTNSEDNERFYNYIKEAIENMTYEEYILASAGDYRHRFNNAYMECPDGSTIEFPLLAKGFEKCRDMYIELSNKNFVDNTDNCEAIITLADEFGYELCELNLKNGNEIFREDIVINEKVKDIIAESANKKLDTSGRVFVLRLYNDASGYFKNLEMFFNMDLVE